MEDWCYGKHKSWWLVFMMFSYFMVPRIQAVCVEEEREALLEIKASLNDSYTYDALDPLLPTWVDHGECCEWERVKCDTTTGHITDLSLESMIPVRFPYSDIVWQLNVSLFLHFKELRSLNLSSNCIDDTIATRGLERLSSLKKLERLDLSYNLLIGNDIIPSLSALTSLKVLDLSGNLEGNFPAHEFAALENLEELYLRSCGYYGSFQIEELSHLNNLQKLDLSGNGFNDTPGIQGCKSLTRLNKLESISLGGNYFNKSIISCLSFLPSLNILDLSYSDNLGSSFPMQELSSLRDLNTLDLSRCGLQSLTLNGTMSNLKHLILDANSFNDPITMSMAAFPSLRFLSLIRSFVNNRGTLVANGTMGNLLHLNLNDNNFTDHDIMSSMAAFPSLKFLSLENCYVGGRLFANGLFLPYTPMPFVNIMFLDLPVPLNCLYV